MKALINDRGHLLIQRKGTFEEQLCHRDNDAACGHWCPLFIEGPDLDVSTGTMQLVTLHCGHGSPTHSIVKDERKEEIPDANH